MTNPPIDPFREKIVMSLRQNIGPQYNLLETNAEQCRRLVIDNPVLSLKELDAIKRLQSAEVRTCLTCS